jgi:UDP-2,3-diacylglucosamine pyrophosphatase LpxH
MKAEQTMTAQSNDQAKAQNYVTKIHHALDAALARAQAAGNTRILNLATDRYIIFSDQHRGARNGADDFQVAERAYNAALAYYLHMGHTLIVLGDVEELWEETPAVVIRAYRHSLELEARFHQRGRYVRIWGNHDDEWQYADSVHRHLDTVYGAPPLHVQESLHFTVVEGTEELGALFLLHGHQGDAFNDKWSRIARIFVRYVWRTFQRLTRISLNTPATSWNLRKKINEAMYAWAAEQHKLILIAGHTHTPVFESQSHDARITEAIAELEERPSESETHQKELGWLLAWREWVRAQDPLTPPQEVSLSMEKPCYFNTGCCCYSDGDITGIEIADGKIRLVRWPDKAHKPQPCILEEAVLRDVLSACQASVKV